MKRRILSIFLLISILLSANTIAFAHGRDEHNQIMSMVLFGAGDYKDGLIKGSSEYNSLEALESAVTLCLDQYNGNYSDELKTLNRMHIHGIPKDIGVIDFSGNQHHRKFTHQGWSHIYSPDKGNWESRKTILLQTVNKVFGFQRRAGQWKFLWSEKDYGYDEQCVAFAKFVYYIHVLADIEESGINEGYSDMIKLALSHPQKDSPDIYAELLCILPVLFRSQSSNNTAYKGLILDIRLQANRARDFVADNPDLHSCYSDYQEFAKELLEKLQSKIPYLLANEYFFKNTFPVQPKTSTG